MLWYMALIYNICIWNIIINILWIFNGNFNISLVILYSSYVINNKEKAKTYYQ